MKRYPSMLWACTLALIVGWLALLPPGFVHAQTAQQTALARSLFAEGVALADKSDWQGAADRFGRAYELKPTAGVAFNHASALAELGRLVEASELLRRVVGDERASEGLRNQARDRLSALEPRLAYLAVTLADAAVAANGQAQIEVDGRELPRAAWGAALPVDPGPHIVRCVVAGSDRAREELTLTEGERREVSLSLPAVGRDLSLLSSPANREAVSPAPRYVADQSDRPERRPVYKSWALWTGLGLAVAGGVVAAVLLTNRSDEPRPPLGTAKPGEVTW